MIPARVPCFEAAFHLIRARGAGILCGCWINSSPFAIYADKPCGFIGSFFLSSDTLLVRFYAFIVTYALFCVETFVVIGFIN